MLEKIILVTGASSGLGRAVCVELGKQGFNVLAMARSEDGLQTTQAQVEEVGGRCLCIPFDLMNFNKYNYIIEGLKFHIPHLNGIVHAAGTLKRCAPMQFVEFRDFRHMLDLHLTAPNLLTQTLLPLLHQASAVKKATVIFVSCDIASTNNTQANWHGYGLAKAALPAAAQMWQQEQASKGLCFYAFNPGQMRTQLFATAFPALETSSVPHPNEIAPQLIKLLDADCAYIAGTHVQIKDFY
ncbi:MAG: SDR family NAD(P)-dependent oxidoreductase [Mariprofundales bacterium]